MNLGEILFLSVGLIVGFIIGAAVFTLIRIKSKSELAPCALDNAEESQQKELVQLRLHSEQLQKKVSACELDLKNANEKINAMTAKNINNKKSNANENAAALEEAKNVIQQLDDSLKATKEKLQNLERDYEEKNAQLAQILAQKSQNINEVESEQTIAILEKDLESAHKTIAGLTTSIEQMKSSGATSNVLQNDGKSQMVLQLNQKLASMSNGLLVQKNQLNALQETLDNKTAQFERIQKELGLEKAKSEQKSQKNSELESVLKASTEKLSQIELDLTRYREFAQNNKQQLEVSEQKRKETLEKMNQMIQGFYDQSLAELTQERDQIKQDHSSLGV